MNTLERIRLLRKPDSRDELGAQLAASVALRPGGAALARPRRQSANSRPAGAACGRRASLAGAAQRPAANRCS